MKSKNRRLGGVAVLAALLIAAGGLCIADDARARSHGSSSGSHSSSYHSTGSHASGSHSSHSSNVSSGSHSTHSSSGSYSGSHKSTYAAGAKRDSHGKIARSEKAKDDFKKQHPCSSTGKMHGACPGYVIDHIVPLKKGGAEALSNMQWQTTEAAKIKDRTE